MVRTLERALLVLVVVLVWAGPLLAAVGSYTKKAPPRVTTPKVTTPKATPKKETTKKDPIDVLFTVPKNATEGQKAAIEELRGKREQELRDALHEKESGADAKAKSAASKKFNDLKKEVRAEIAKIMHKKGSGDAAGKDRKTGARAVTTPRERPTTVAPERF